VTVGRENITVAKMAHLRIGPAISGTLAPEHEATVRAEVSGPVLATNVEQGQPVKRGTVLARIDDTAIRDSYLSARSAVRSAEAALVVARRNAERSTKLAEAGAIAETELETARWNATNAEATLADAQARLVSAQEQLGKTIVRAPFSGVVSERQVNAGDIVQPGGEMFTIVEPSSMRLEASVPAQQLGDLRIGAPVEFEVSGYPGRTFSGRITRINPMADRTTGQVRIFVQIPNAGRNLVAGLFAEGRVASESREALVVPLTAVDQRGITPTVTRIKNGRVDKVPVTPGLRDAATETVEIRSGLAAGDTVLLGAAQGITAGTVIRVAEVGGDREQGAGNREQGGRRE
jgi:RND family efflux transporter MFP subunit